MYIKFKKTGQYRTPEIGEYFKLNYSESIFKKISRNRCVVAYLGSGPFRYDFEYTVESDDKFSIMEVLKKKKDHFPEWF